MSNTAFEVQIRREGRWTIEGTFDDERRALSSARSWLAVSGVEEAKVLKFRTLAGLSLETVIFQKAVPVVKEKPMTLGGTAEGAPYCTTPGDLYGFESRAVTGRLLRPFLDKFHITPTELLHSWTYLRKLDEQGLLLSAAIQAVARHHADRHGLAVPARARMARSPAKTMTPTASTPPAIETIPRALPESGTRAMAVARETRTGAATRFSMGSLQRGSSRQSLPVCR